MIFLYVAAFALGHLKNFYFKVIPDIFFKFLAVNLSRFYTNRNVSFFIAVIFPFCKSKPATLFTFCFATNPNICTNRILTIKFQLGRITGSRQLGRITGSRQLGIITGSRQLGIITGSRQLGRITGSRQLGRITGSRQLGIITGSRQLGIITGSRQLGIITGSRQLGIITGSRQLGRITGSRQLGIIFFVWLIVFFAKVYQKIYCRFYKPTKTEFDTYLNFCGGVFGVTILLSINGTDCFNFCKFTFAQVVIIEYIKRVFTKMKSTLTNLCLFFFIGFIFFKLKTLTGHIFVERFETFH
uniref:Uncharacterized protein n=1 Tax=uncultured marine virus TaxID=186617 RepID=A0A0F7L1T9_9VIRU|nr:hypothetical protein PPSC2_p0048 [uncultured marine virus]